MSGKGISRRKFLGHSIGAVAAGLSAPMIVPRHVLGGPGYTPPSEIVTRGVIGCGGRGSGFVRGNPSGGPYRTLAVCDVDKGRLNGALRRAGDGCEGYGDFRRVLDRKDIDVVYIGTPPHWHALISIAAAQAGKDIYCEKPMTRFIAEGRAVVEAVRRYGRIFQIGTFGRFGGDRRRRKIMASGLLGPKINAVFVKRGEWKVREWSGKIDQPPEDIPPDLDYNLWLGPAPYKPYFRHRVHGSFRGYWDYDGGGLADMGQHYLDRIQYEMNKDATSPVEIEAYAPWPAHPDAVGMWGYVTLKYEDGTTFVYDSREWGKPYEGPGERLPSMSDLTETQRKQLAQMPDPEPMIGEGEDGFERAVKQRRECGGNAEASHRGATLLHLANIAIRLGRKLHYDPVAERFVGDEEANRLVDVPMRAPWHL